MTETSKVICSNCGAGSYRASTCERCKGVGMVPVDTAFLKDIRSRLICVSGAEVEALLDEIDRLKEKDS